MLRIRLIIILLSVAGWTFSQSIPSNQVVEIQELVSLLKSDVKEQISKDENISEATLADYFRNKFSERFFYPYRSFKDRLVHYNGLYQNNEEHRLRALDHLDKYADSTQWLLPFNYLNGDPVNAYALRHLARQHKMVDIAFYYSNEGREPKYIQYFENQMKSLNAAFHAGEYEKIEDGNGVYEAFRSGYRILNWLWIHNMFLGEAEYSDDDQLRTIATLLQHGQHLYERNAEFRSGNHQTRGVSALAMVAILLRDFQGTDLWLERAMLRLSEHLDKEINDDGFQFERSVHYHMSDINNYFYVYQLAKINSIEVDKAWEEKLRGLFSTLVKVAYPNRRAPVLQDDTDIPWAETNDISGAMTLGYLLFEDPVFGYFASDKVDQRVYWFLSNDQIKMLERIVQEKPTYGSLAFDDTGYYIMRKGWQAHDKMMVISAGLDDKKPDHQHGDMLGIQAVAYGHAILPNYQVRYSLKDFDLFKNSMVKNVALVDDELQGKQWTSNKGGSGFGKFGDLPDPQVIAWESNDEFDFFAGTHDGFENIGVDYTRQVIFVKDEFWIVKDKFKSDTEHQYKQVWQGHYTVENGSDLIRATFPDATGCDILQLHPTDLAETGGARGKTWTVVSKNEIANFDFASVIFPYHGYDNRVDEDSDQKILKGWSINDASWTVQGKDPITLSKDQNIYCLNVQRLSLPIFKIIFDTASDFFLHYTEDQVIIRSIDTTTPNLIVELGDQRVFNGKLDHQGLKFSISTNE